MLPPHLPHLIIQTGCHVTLPPRLPQVLSCLFLCCRALRGPAWYNMSLEEGAMTQLSQPIDSTSLGSNPTLTWGWADSGASGQATWTSHLAPWASLSVSVQRD